MNRFAILTELFKDASFVAKVQKMKDNVGTNVTVSGFTYSIPFNGPESNDTIAPGSEVPDLGQQTRADKYIMLGMPVTPKVNRFWPGLVQYVVLGHNKQKQFSFKREF
jgi:hypothetical protein